MKVVFSFFLSIYSLCGMLASWTTRHMIYLLCCNIVTLTGINRGFSFVNIEKLSYASGNGRQFAVIMKKVTDILLFD